MASHVSAQLRFLTDAAHLLATTAPETSAYLMHRRTELALSHDLPLSDVQRQHVCTSCGHIMMPGRGGDALRFETGRAARQKAKKKATTRKPAPAERGITKVAACGSCLRETRIALPAPSPVTRKKKTLLARPATDDQSAEVQKPSANATSKKRAKSRKAGLQALLDQQQEAARSNTSGPGLSLSSFRKKQ